MAEQVRLQGGDAPPGGGSLNYPQESDGGKPEHIPDKFWNAETGEVDTASLAQSYTELESKLGQSTSEEKTSDTTPTETTESTANLNLSKFEKEWADNDNSLTEETYDNLQTNFGLSKDDVNSYISFRQQEADTFVEEIYTMAGGQPQYESLLNWATNNLPEEEVETLTKTLSSSDNDQIRVSVLKLQNQYREAVGAEPQRLAGNTSQTANTLVPFASLQEAVEARRDKRYDVDPAYRELWERRVGASPFVETS